MATCTTCHKRPTKAKSLCGACYGRSTYDSDWHRRRQWRRLYGITEEQYARMLIRQGGTCALCSATDAGPLHPLFLVDHDHETGKVRGLLCRRCNTAIAQLGDNAAGARRLLEYVA